ncbi:putative membrane protein [marine gamma proteobacterium HTCC2207]|uniref:Putative membrane protein n=1 Tax=gamma proteobacterium HTCC2207 TaxID=314287 RepID=Q1YQ39_9GAMM|nr:putative membrane protein [marine gamma proteobacterium HTCC2207] [gamma proteobacterium HTCC2207]
MSNWPSTKQRTALKASTQDWLTEVWMIFSSLMKIMIPALIIVRCIELLGWIEALGEMIHPVMILVGLPGETGLVWMAAMMGNIYTGMAVFYQLGMAEQLTIGQVSVVSSMMLIAHSLPIEIAIARAVGISLWFTLCLRISGAFIFGFICFQTYSHLALLQEPAPQLWQPGIVDPSWGYWFLTQGQTIVMALAIIAALTFFLRILRVLGVERLIHFLLAPVLRLLGIATAASNIIIVGLTLGLSFGGGLLINEARRGHIAGKDIFMSMAFLGLCHSLIEDTLLMLLLGADLSTIVFARLAFSLLAILALSRLLDWLPANKQSWFYRQSPS